MDTRPHDEGVENVYGRDIYADSEKEIEDTILDLLTSMDYPTHLDNDLGGDDNRPGRAAIILGALAEALEAMHGTRNAANMLVLGAVRAAVNLENSRRRKL